MIINFKILKANEIFSRKVDIKSLDKVESIVSKYTNYIEWERNQNVSKSPVGLILTSSSTDAFFASLSYPQRLKRQPR